MNRQQRRAAARRGQAQAMQQNRDSPAYWGNYGLALHNLGRLEEAVAGYDRALALAPDMAEIHYNRANALQSLARLDEAVAGYDRAIALRPDLVEAYANRGVALRALRRFAEAVANFDHAIALKPGSAEVYYNRGNALRHLDRLDAAVASYDRAIALAPDMAEAYANRGVALQGLRRLDEALESCDRAIALKPDFAEALNNRGNIFREFGRFDQALESCDRAIALAPDMAEAYATRGLALQGLRRLDEALESCDRAIALKPDFAEALNNRGNIFREFGRFDQALESCDRVIALKPDFAEAYVNRGIALQDLRRLDEALESCDHALALKPDFAEAYVNRGAALQGLRRLDEALESCDRAIALKPDHAEALNNRGYILRDLGRFGLALESYERALAVRPDFPDALVGWIEGKRRHCDWSGEGEHEWKVRITGGLQASLRVVFSLLSLASPAEHLAYARQVAAQFGAPPASFPPAAPRSGGRIRLGYLSADLRTHPVAFLVAGLIERHDRRRFEVLGYSCGPDDGSAIRARLTGAFDHVVDLQAASDRQAAERIHADAVDILVDLTGYTAHGRTAILAHRPAPIQVNYLGYPGTTGADFIDYIIVDRFVVPADQQPFFSERLVHLPNCYQPCEIIQEVAERTPSRAECGLPEQGFVFCCFNNVLKITPELFDIWMRLLAAVPGSVLWLVTATPSVKDNLWREAVDRRVAADRLVFAAPTSRPEYLARLGLADLFLDTLPYNAGATASDALWAGLPVLTCSGDTYVGRMAGAVLTAAGLPELITTSLKGYESLAIRLATEPGLLAPLRQRLACNRSIMPLFDIARFTRDLEAAYRQMHETWQAGRPPSAFTVSAAADN